MNKIYFCGIFHLWFFLCKKILIREHKYVVYHRFSEITIDFSSYVEIFFGRSTAVLILAECWKDGLGNYCINFVKRGYYCLGAARDVLSYSLPTYYMKMCWKSNIFILTLSLRIVMIQDLRGILHVCCGKQGCTFFSPRVQMEVDWHVLK